jgi:hypothetical protein
MWKCSRPLAWSHDRLVIKIILHNQIHEGDVGLKYLALVGDPLFPPPKRKRGQLVVEDV